MISSAGTLYIIHLICFGLDCMHYNLVSWRGLPWKPDIILKNLSFVSAKLICYCMNCLIKLSGCAIFAVLNRTRARFINWNILKHVDRCFLDNMYGTILSHYVRMYTHPSGMDFFEIQHLLKPSNPTEHFKMLGCIHPCRPCRKIGRRNPISTWTFRSCICVWHIIFGWIMLLLLCTILSMDRWHLI
jgi:hypothetical protein